MNEMEIKQIYKQASYLDILLREFDVSIRQADNFFGKNRKKIDSMVNILSSKAEEDISKCIALLHILTRGSSYALIEKYFFSIKKQHVLYEYKRKHNLLMKIIEYTKKYKLELLAALLDETFFNEVMKWYENISSGKQPNDSNIIPFPKTIDLPDEKELTQLTARDTKHGYKGFDFLDVDDICGYSGKFIFLQKDAERLKVQFQFFNKIEKTTKELTNTIPFYLKIELITDTESGEKRIPIILNKEETEPIKICSKKDYFDFSRKYKIGKTVYLLPYVEDAQ
jgi:hypothetical protein